MSEEQARQRAQELTKKALAEAENETFKIDRSLQGKHIVTKSGKCYCARISGHTYVAHLDGVAYLGTVAVAKTGFNTVSWRP